MPVRCWTSCAKARSCSRPSQLADVPFQMMACGRQSASSSVACSMGCKSNCCDEAFNAICVTLIRLK